MNADYELIYKKPKEHSIKNAATSNKIDKLEKRMKYIKKQKFENRCDSSWCNKSRLSPKIYDTWYSPLNEKALKIDSACMHASKCDYQNLVELLFTSGELDPDKVLCLHVLASHPCEKLTLPSNTHVRLEHQTALEKLIERSRSFCGYRSGIKYNLPIYILNLNERRKLNSASKYNKRYITETKIQDGRLATRLVINENLWRLVQTVIEALHHCNPSKMSYLLKIAQNGNHVRQIINKPQLQSFLKALTSQNIILSSDSFLLTRPFESCVQLRIDNPSHNLEVLIQKIRRRVLNDQTYDTKNQIDDLFYNPSMLEIDDRVTRKNIRNIKSEMDGCLGFCNFDVEKISTILNTKIREAQEKDLKFIKKPVVPCTCKTEQNKKLEPSDLRKSYCYACTENWRKNMISTEKKKKKYTIKDFEKNYKACISRSTRWLKLIIREEEENLTKVKLKNYKPKFDFKNNGMELVQKKPMVLNINGKKKFQKIPKTLANDTDTLNTSYAENNLNLAKIKNEISTKENKKRIKKFLEQPIYAARKMIVQDDYNIISI